MPAKIAAWSSWRWHPALGAHVRWEQAGAGDTPGLVWPRCLVGLGALGRVHRPLVGITGRAYHAIVRCRTRARGVP